MRISARWKGKHVLGSETNCSNLEGVGFRLEVGGGRIMFGFWRANVYIWKDTCIDKIMFHSNDTFEWGLDWVGMGWAGVGVK